jgi:hypothetical protein
MDNIKIDPGEMGWSGVDWIGLAQDRDRWRALADAVINLPLPLNEWLYNRWSLE